MTTLPNPASPASRLWAGRPELWRPAPLAAVHGFLRLACALCFIGHGAWGIITKPGWLPFFAAFGIPEAVAWQLQPVVGAVDIALGVSILVYPTRAVLTWMVFWTIFTAALRPLVGLGWWEFLERAGNYAPPLALLVLALLTQARLGWLTRIEVRWARPEQLVAPAWILRIGIALFMIGHGGFQAIQGKTLFLEHYAAIGIHADMTLVSAVGWFEISLGLAALVVSRPSFFLGIVAWKVATELLYPLSGGAVDTWEWVERGGDYLAPLALIALLKTSRPFSEETAHGRVGS